MASFPGLFTPEIQPWAITWLQNIPRNELLQVAKGYIGRRLGNSKSWTENPWDSREIRGLRMREGRRHHKECEWKLQNSASRRCADLLDKWTQRGQYSHQWGQLSAS